MYCKQVASIFLSKVSLIQKDLEKCLANIVNYVGVRIYQGIRMIKRSEQTIERTSAYKNYPTLPHAVAPNSAVPIHS